jgi:hypothetical protein
MKKLFLLIFALTGTAIIAQTTIQLTNMSTSMTVPADAVISVTQAAFSNKKVTFDIKNTSGTTKTYNAKRYDILLNDNSTDTAIAYFCFGGLCYGAQTYVSPNPITLGPGKSASDTTAAYYMLIADLDEASTRGCSYIKYTFFNVNQVSDSIQVSIKYNCYLAGVKDIQGEISSIHVYPNPARETAKLQINSLNTYETNVMLYNSLGDLVITKPVSVKEGKNSINMDISSLPVGIYFISMKSGTGTLTKKLIIN